MISEALRRVIPESLVNRVREIQRKRTQSRVQSLPQLSADRIEEILRDEMGLVSGDLAFIHSSVDRLHLSFPFFQILGILRNIVGPEGTLVFPTYPRLSSYRFLMSGEVFDVRKTPSFMGILSEFARRQKNAVRSLHPTKSVVAIGPLAEALTGDHHRSPFPYDVTSPYFRTVEHSGKVIGLGVGTYNLSLVHSVDDILGDQFPVRPYHEQIFRAPCIDSSGTHCVVPTYAHDMRKMDFNIPEFMSNHIDPEIGHDFNIDGMHFFIAQADPLFHAMKDLALRDITIYRKKHYTR